MLKLRTLREAPCLYLFFFVASFVVFFPGLADANMEALNWEVQKNFYSNWHSVLLEVLMHSWDSVCPSLKDGSFLFLLTLSQYWLAQGIIASTLDRSFRSQLVFVTSAVLFPPIMLLLIGVGKDSLMCSTLLLSYAILRSGGRCKSRISFYAAILFAAFLLFCALAERHNAICAVLPIATYLVSIALTGSRSVRDWKGHRYKVITLAVVLTIFLAAVKIVLEKYLMNLDQHPAQMVIVWDLVAISVLSNEVCLPNVYTEKEKPFNLSYLRQLYLEYDNSTIFCFRSNSGAPLLYVVHNDSDYLRLVKSWTHSICKHPVTYLKHRTIAFLSVLGVLNADKAPHPYDGLTTFPSDGKVSYLQLAPFWQFMRRFIWVPATINIPEWPMRAYPYFLALCALFACVRMRVLRITKGEYFLLLSALGYALPFLFIASNNDQRYFLYVICVCQIIFTRIAIYCFPSKPFRICSTRLDALSKSGEYRGSR